MFTIRRLVILTLVCTCGCAPSAFDADKYRTSVDALQPRGYLRIAVLRQLTVGCDLQLIFRNENNEGGLPIEAVIELIFYDGADNTLEKTFVMFDPVLPQKYQEKTRIIRAACDRIYKAYVARGSAHVPVVGNMEIKGVSTGNVLPIASSPMK